MLQLVRLSAIVNTANKCGAETLRILAAIFVLFGTVATAESIAGREGTVTDGRTDRTKSAPLVVALHAFLETPRRMQRKTNFDKLAKSKRFLVLYPAGQRRKWNDGRNPRWRTDDVKYLSAAISSLIDDGRADPKQVFLAGHSNGGGMAMRLACERPELIAGIAVAATKAPTNYQCPGGRSVPAIFFYGTEDPISPPQGRPNNHRLGGAVSEKATLRLWATRNGCKGRSIVQKIDRRKDGTSVQIIRYNGCRQPLVHVSIIGHGHGWPGATRFTRLQGPATQEINAALVAWEFFSKL